MPKPPPKQIVTTTTATMTMTTTKNTIKDTQHTSSITIGSNSKDKLATNTKTAATTATTATTQLVMPDRTNILD